MKLKQRKGDFRVEEISRPVLDPAGRHFVHRLVKRGITTPEALRRIGAAVGIPSGEIGIGGLKDRQAVAAQLVSLPGVRADVRGPGFQLRFIGRSREPISSARMEGNRFVLVLRDLGPADLDRFRVHLAAVLEDGSPNYFDDQRFGVLRYGQGFIARSIVLGDLEGAVRAYLCLEDPGCPTRDRAARTLIRHRFGDWRFLARRVRLAAFRPVLEALHRSNGDPAAGLRALPPRVLGFHFNAWQSHLWNGAVDRLLRRLRPEGFELPTIAGRLHAPASAGAELRDRTFPLPEPGCLARHPEARQALEEALRADGVRLEQLGGLPIPRFRFLAGERRLFVKPEGLMASEDEEDDANPGRRKLRVRFFLPRGAYATLLVKRLFAEAPREPVTRASGTSRRTPARSRSPSSGGRGSSRAR
jgi:tRNA pseudouridine13 synthase